MKKFAARIVNKVLSVFKVKLISIKHLYNNNFEDIFVKDVKENKIVSLNSISALSNNIKGMISHRAGEELFSLVYMQSLSGNVVEIGSFQGKSTFFLGSAVKLSGNGKLFAIDHFKGNIGKEKFYKVGKSDLSDLEEGFKNNIERFFLNDTVTLYNESTETAIKYIEDASVRFLFIDGDHTAAGVSKDLKLFRRKLKSGAIIAFDDYAPSFPGVIDVVNKFIISEKINKKYLIGRTLVIEL